MNAVILQPTHNLDLKLAAMMREKVSNLGRSPYQHWLIDLENVNAIGNAGLLTLLEAHKFALKTGRRLSLFNLRSSVAYLLQVTELDRRLVVGDPDASTIAMAARIVF